MAEDKNNEISISRDTTISNSQSTISTLEYEEKFIIKRTSNHNEISIIENNWKQIKRKIGLINVNKRFDFGGVIVGAIIPYAIDVAGAVVKKETPDYLPLVICLVLYVAINKLSKHVEWLGENRTQENQLHLADLKNLIYLVESSSQNEQS